MLTKKEKFIEIIREKLDDKGVLIEKHLEDEIEYSRNGTMTLINLVLSPYYQREENKSRIDKFIHNFDKVYTSGFGPVSMGFAFNEKIDELELMLNEMNK